MVESPCISVCKYNRNYICIGCFRSAQEISEWAPALDSEKLQIIENAKRRKSNLETVKKEITVDL